MMNASAPLLRIGSRGSPLALVQARQVQARLVAALGCPEAAIAIETFKTTGDRVQDRALAEAGGKGLFTKELEEALADGRIDLAVHSAKDMPTVLPDGLTIAACLPREDVRDVFISHAAPSLAALPAGAVVGTAAMRRQALIKRLRPDLKVVIFRGNVETRLAKLARGEADATLLALAGLNRLGLTEAATAILPVEAFLPAAGQGIVAIEVREKDARTREMLREVDSKDAKTALRGERAFLAALDGSCRSPIAAHATMAGDEVRLRGLILRPDGSEAFETERIGPRSEAAALGRDAGEELRRRAPAGFWTEFRAG